MAGLTQRLKRQLLARRSSAARIEGYVADGLLVLGHRSYGNFDITHYRGDTSVVRIGRFCSIGDDVTFLPGGNHRPDWVTTFPVRIRFDLPGARTDGHPSSRGDIVVGHDVWIGRGAKILSGVSVGDGAVVGAYSVVSRDVAPYTVVAGNPAREIRRRFPVDVAGALTRIAWWNWPDEVVADRVSELCSDQVEAFVARYDPAGSPGPDAPVARL
jgi:acetyltransferase-like isoleucine patch superfamily enzyme